MKYRREIDGLRAVAVVPVMLYHAKVLAFSGGFVGVDVFFVISGYLITTLILADLDAGTFSISRFYERRARRILPALFMVVLCAMVPAVLLMLPYELSNFAKSVAGVATFTSNFVFWRESGYFAPANDLQPLLHTWSLAIEEQFYLLFPVALTVLARWNRRALWPVFSAVMLMSLGLSEWAARHSYAGVNYYLLPTRAWELLIGTLCALFLMRREAASREVTADIGTLVGVGLILWSVFEFDQTAPFPGVRALVPTVGTALVILFGASSPSAQRWLGARPVVAIGLVSYGAYLWHQPLLAFARLAGHTSTLSTAVVAAILVLTFVLAWASYVLVERPIRHSRTLSRRAVFGAAGGGSLCLLALAGVTIQSGGFVNRFPMSDRGLLAVNPLEMGRYTEQRFRDRVGTRFVEQNKRHVAVIGDSYAQDFVNMLGETGLLDSAEYVTAPIPARCPKYLGAADVPALYRANGEGFDAEDCMGVYNFLHAKALAGQADVVILAAHWRAWEADRILETIHSLDLKPSQRTIVVGSKEFGHIDPLRYLPLTGAQRTAIRNPVTSLQLSTDSTFRMLLLPDEFLDFQRLFCGEDASCPVFTSDGHLVSYDGSHLTPDGARYVGNIIFLRNRNVPSVRAALHGP